jgi:hypothetical protein
MSPAAQQTATAAATYSHAFRREAEVRELPRGHLEVLDAVLSPKRAYNASGAC